MTDKKETVAERIARMAGSASASSAPVVEAKTEKLKKRGYQKKGKNGGKRPGSGRKATEASLAPAASDLRRNHLQFIREHANEIVMVREIDRKTGKTRDVKMTRLAMTLEMLMSNVKKGDQSAIHEYLDRVLGRAVQPIGGDDDMPIVVRVDF